MSTKVLGVLALVVVLVIGAVIGVLLMVRPAEEAPPARDVEAARPAEEAPPAPEVEAARPAEEAPPAQITAPVEIIVPSGFTALSTMDEEGVTVTQYIGSGTVEDALDAFEISVMDAGWTPVLEAELPAVAIPEAAIAAAVTGALFERGDEFLSIWAMQAEGQITVGVTVAPKEVFEALAAAHAEKVIPALVVTPIAEAVHFSKLIPFLPEAPSGWVAEEPSGATVREVFVWSMAERRYRKPGTVASASIRILDGAHHWYWTAWRAFFEYQDAHGYMKRTTFHGFPAWEEHMRPHDYTLWIGIDGRIMVLISVEESDLGTLYAFADRIDFRGIAALK